MKLLKIGFPMQFSSKVNDMILCECGEVIDGNTFKDYINTSSNPSTPTIGHKNCGLLFDFIDGEIPKKFSSKIELKCITMKFAEHKKLDNESAGRLLLEVDRLKSAGRLSDGEILAASFKKVLMIRGDY